MGNLGFGELLIILFVLILLFGGKKIPDLAKSLGDGIRLFKKAMNENDKDTSEKK